MVGSDTASDPRFTLTSCKLLHHVVDVVLALSVRRNPCDVDSLVGKNGAFNDKVIEGTELCEKIAVLLLWSDAMSALDQLPVDAVGSHF